MDITETEKRWLDITGPDTELCRVVGKAVDAMGPLDAAHALACLVASVCSFGKLDAKQVAANGKRTWDKVEALHYVEELKEQAGFR